MGNVTHCDDAAGEQRGALPSRRVDEEEIVSVEEEVEAMISEPLQIIMPLFFEVSGATKGGKWRNNELCRVLK